jgi:hypothetical protein
MSEQQDARHMLDRAERAATAGDLASADELLRGAARIQEEQLGPLHPDLANTLNNLAIVAERTGRPEEAETLYRRAAAIAAAALPSDHPMVVESRQNLEDFCRARGLSIDAPVVVAPAPVTKTDVDVVASEQPPEGVEPPAAVRPANTVTATAAPLPPVAARRDPSPPAPLATQSLPLASTPSGASHSLAWLATGVVVLVAVVLLVLRPWSSRDAPTPVPTSEPAAARPAEPYPPPIAAPPAPTAPRAGDPNVAAEKPVAGAITVATAQLCRTFSTNGGRWRCDPVGGSVAAGPLVFYTRVRSPRDTAVVHRWYRGNTLRQSVRLTTRANATEGYRTYSRQTVDEGEWRVEIRSADDSLLHEQRFAVR